MRWKPLKWKRLDSRAHAEQLGFIPEFLDENDPRPAVEQFNDRYGFGGGWNPMPGFKLVNFPPGPGNFRLKYEGDPPMAPLFLTKLRDEMILVFEHSWVLIVRKDGTWEAARMD